MGRILIIEDRPANLVLAAKLLRAAGHEVLMAVTGADGVQVTQTSRPDLVLMDLGLPDMDGVRAMQAIRADQAVRDVRVVAFTAHAMAGDRDAFLASGFDGYMSKPIDFATFASTVAALLP